MIVFSQLAGLARAGRIVLGCAQALPLGVAGPALGAGVTAVTGIAFVCETLRIGVMSIAGPIISLGTAAPIVVGLSRGERPSALQLAGIVNALGGVFLAAQEKSAGRNHQASSRLSVLPALVAAGKRFNRPTPKDETIGPLC